MPQTINGIGTWYYGKKNLRKTPGVCEQCGQAVELQSYETRLWFVIFFIPIIPLGKKQILDYCPKCTRHRAVPVDEWNRVREQSIQEAGAEAAKDPDNPEAATELLGTLVAFHKEDEAARLAELMARKFPDNADVQFHLGSYYEHVGRGAEADGCFARAFELEPGNAAFRRAVAIGCAEKGDLGRATELLAAMTDEQAREHAAAFYVVATTHQKRGEHKEALTVFARMLARSPGLKKDKTFCKAVRVSERALGREGALVPKPWMTARRGALIAASAVAVVAVAGLLAYRGSTRRTLHIVNRLGAPATVTIDGGGGWTVEPKAQRTVSVRAGRHQATIESGGGPAETVEFTLGGREDTYVLNPGSAAAFLVQDQPYGPADREPTLRIHCGKPFFAFRDIDYPFQDFPEQVKGPAGRGVWKRGLQVLELEPIAALFLLRYIVPEDDLFALAEHHLSQHPDSEGVLTQYFDLCTRKRKLPRARDFLAKRLDRRPVVILWHTCYQQACQALGEEETLVARYDRLLASAPNDSALLYLRGRLAAGHAKTMDYYERAIAADPKNGHAWVGKAYRLMTVGDFAAARQPCEEACRLDPEDRDRADLLFALRRAAGEAEALETELKELVAKEPHHGGAVARLVPLLLAKGDELGAKAIQDGYTTQVAEMLGPGAPEVVLGAKIQWAYLTGDAEAALENARQLQDQMGRDLTLFHLHVERGALREAEGLVDKQAPWWRGGAHLLLCLAWQEQGDRARAEAHWQRAAAAFAARPRREQQIAALMRKGDALKAADLDDAYLNHTDKAALLLALAERLPALRGELVALAEKLNYGRTHPCRLLARRVAALRKK